MLLALPLLVLAAAPSFSARYLFFLHGIPVGTVELRFDAAAREWSYTSRQLHRREDEIAERVREATFELEEDGRIRGERAMPQGLWLSRGPRRLGCALAREELGGREGPHCLTFASRGALRGTLAGAPFRAREDARGLVELILPDARFRRISPRARVRPPPELFSRGLPIQRAAGARARSLALEPPLAVPRSLPSMDVVEARWAEELAERIHRELEKAPEDAELGRWGAGAVGSCLAHARRFVLAAQEEGHSAAIVHGLLADHAGRARPHAWVRVRTRRGVLDLDPTSLEPVRPSTHLALALVELAQDRLAGERWLALMRGEHRVVRRTPGPG